MSNINTLVFSEAGGLRRVKSRLAYDLTESEPIDAETRAAIIDSLGIDADSRLIEIADAESYHVLVPTFDSDEITSSKTVRWPDGSAGVWTGTNKNATFKLYDGWTLTHVNSGKTVTQPPVTRDSSGRAISYPTLTIS